MKKSKTKKNNNKKKNVKVKEKELIKEELSEEEKEELEHHKKQREKKIIISLVIIFLILFIFISLAVNASIRSVKKYNSVKENEFVVTFMKNGDSLSNIITLKDKDSLYYEDYKKSQMFKFSVKNDSDHVKKFRIVIVDDFDMIQLDKCKDKLYSKQDIFYSLNDEVGGILSDLFYEEDYLVYSGEVAPHDEEFFDLRLWANRYKDKHGHYHGLIKVIEEK